MTKLDRTTEVLIVDDEEDVCILLKIFLTKRGYKVHCCHSLADMREEILDHLYDVVLLDINLQDGNGLSILERNLLPRETHVIVMSAQAHLAEKAVSLGAEYFIAKPFSSSKVLEAIEEIPLKQ